MCDYELDGNFILLFFYPLKCILMLHPSFPVDSLTAQAAITNYLKWLLVMTTPLL